MKWPLCFMNQIRLLYGEMFVDISGVKQVKRIEIPITNERERQTFFGALNFHTQKFIAQDHEKGNTKSTIAFLRACLKSF